MNCIVIRANSKGERSECIGKRRSLLGLIEREKHMIVRIDSKAGVGGILRKRIFISINVKEQGRRNIYYGIGGPNSR